MTIDSRVRRLLGIRPGTVVVQRVVDDHLEIDFVMPEDQAADSDGIAVRPGRSRN